MRLNSNNSLLWASNLWTFMILGILSFALKYCSYKHRSVYLYCLLFCVTMFYKHIYCVYSSLLSEPLVISKIIFCYCRKWIFHNYIVLHSIFICYQVITCKISEPIGMVSAPAYQLIWEFCTGRVDSISRVY